MKACARLALALAIGLGTAIVLAAAGCAFSPSARGRSPLSPVKPSLETSTLEVVFIRHAYELPALNEELWREVDETQIPAEVRQALEQNGLRAGVISGTLPAALESALSGEQKTRAADAGEIAPSETVGQLDSEPLVRRRTLYALPGQRSELLASGVYERLPLLVRDGTEVRGAPYAKAQALFAVKAHPNGDGRARLSFLPEVQHGEVRQEFRADDGVFRTVSGRAKVAFDKMAIDVVLSPGQSILLGTRTERPGSVGHYFFTESLAGQLEQKLMLVRFEGTKYDNLLLTADRAAKPAKSGALR